MHDNRSWPTRWYRAAALAGVLGITLMACGGASGESATEIHDRWLTALRTNDRTQALALFAETAYRDTAVDSKLRMMQAYIHSTLTTGPHATGGLVDVQAVRIEDRGAGKRAYSRWQYVKRTECHATDLTSTPEGWRVVDYNLTSPAACA